MFRIGERLGRLAQRWLEQFRSRHGLVAATPAAKPADDRLLLHVGCGFATIDNLILPGFKRQPWAEIRLDADARMRPDIIGTMTDMAAVPSASVDAVYSAHGIEHLFWHDVPRALAEFHRVLDEDGFVLITCPDVQSAAAMIAEDRMFDTAYLSAAGAITPFDILYSYRPFVEASPDWMAHRCGFTLTTLTKVLADAGFASIQGCRRLGDFDLWVIATKRERSPDEMAALAADYLPQVA
jgi:SAM-dependent methyltransferase